MNRVLIGRATRGSGADVALKILPDSYGVFGRSYDISLNHPNIANIYGVDDSSGTPALRH